MTTCSRSRSKNPSLKNLPDYFFSPIIHHFSPCHFVEHKHGESCIISTEAGRAPALFALSYPVEGIQVCHSGVFGGIKKGLCL